ncbi:LytR/AlgR family response regulator transcription factor [Desulforamulus ruminis]|uniref:Stage 0 sporulation protein A homolog n=1 Tax=Desulforamulus ruminis (strain ATCC 23193 / DSM 2154 / NCIMB 8452 / DL) TaxID=696281 RepID=F6DLG2_DESRL|nr:LytTR family DNA-binding domain-containing protein [Desulforamulus ruminis]AEG60510.1 LytTr DNA-binding region [Desulforamulus ruminis DSM 2154]
MVTILLLEDEHYIRRFIKQLVSGNPLVDKVIDTPSGKEAIGLAGKYKPNIALLDIKLAPGEGLDGIQVAKTIHDYLNPETHFVFITGYSEYAIESFAVHPYDYILKPLEEGKLDEVISNLAVKVKDKIGTGHGPRKITVKAGNKQYIISLENIIFIEKQGKCSLIHTESGIYKSYQTMESFESMLGSNFLRVHRSFIVNLNKIRGIREVGNRSHMIDFDGYDRVALMSRYKYEKHRRMFTPL